MTSQVLESLIYREGFISAANNFLEQINHSQTVQTSFTSLCDIISFIPKNDKNVSRNVVLERVSLSRNNRVFRTGSTVLGFCSSKKKIHSGASRRIDYRARVRQLSGDFFIPDLPAVNPSRLVRGSAKKTARVESKMARGFKERALIQRQRSHVDKCVPGERRKNKAHRVAAHACRFAVASVFRKLFSWPLQNYWHS